MSQGETDGGKDRGTVRSLKGERLGTATIDASAFGEGHHPVVLREAVLMYEANRRVGTAKVKSRSEVSGSTKKIYKQKHTGRARHGDKKAPIFRGGGIAHGPTPRDYSYSMPRKALKQALRVALAAKIRDGEVLRWEGLSLDRPATAQVRRGLASLGAEASALIVSDGAADRNLLLSVRNLPRVRILPAAELNAHDVVAHRWIVLLDGAFEALRARAGEDTRRRGEAESDRGGDR
jgi:large subunit ribosomal protein L4